MSGFDFMDVNDAVHSYMTGRLTGAEIRDKMTGPGFLEEVTAQVNERYHAMSVAMRIHDLEKLEETMHNGGPAMLKHEIDELEELRSLYAERGWVVTIV